jgi:hypothetical protein
MQKPRPFDYFHYMDSWVVLVPLLCFLVGACLLAVPAIYHIESYLKDVLIAVGGLLAGQVTILLSEIPRAKERSLEKRDLAVSAVLVGVNVGCLSLIGDLQKAGSQPKFLAKASAHFRRLGISEEAFNKVSKSHVSQSESLPAAKFLCDFYEGGIGETHPLLLPLYRAGITSMAVGNILFHLARCRKGSTEETEYRELKQKAIRNLKQSIAGVSESREYRRPGEDVLKPILELSENRHAPYQEVVRYIDSLSGV